MTGDILEKQRVFFREGKTLSVAYRREMLVSLRKTVRQMEDEIAEALHADIGKSRTEAYMSETGMVLSELGYAIKNVRQLSRKRRVRTPAAQFPAKSYIIPEPYGNVLVMSPWNYPVLLGLAPLISAIAAGNTVMLKPSAYSPESSRIIKKIISSTFPEDLAAVTEGGREENASLLEMKFDYIFFTGSKSVGRLVMEKAAAHLTPVTLELGGKSPVIVDSTADIRLAARRIVFGKYLNCGQTCIAPDYILVHEDIEDRFIRACIEETEKTLGKNPIENPEYGKIINRKHYDRLLSAIVQCRNAGMEVLGGESDEEKLKISPAIVLAGKISCPEAWKNLVVMQEEIFGPVMPVLSYSDINDAVSFIDAAPRPLATYIFTKDNILKDNLLGRLHFGGGCVNDTIVHIATDRMPFGGVGESGMGSYHGKYGFETFSHLKSIVEKPFLIDLPFRYRPYSKMKARLIGMFLR